MRYYYQEYQFDLKTLTLYKSGVPLALKNNEAKLLAMFIENQENIFSKDKILNNIWGDQSVSEQVVFQNISQLRALFGSQAIKTFPKKGYQWQLAFSSSKVLKNKPEVITLKSIKSRHQYYYLAISLALITFSILFFWFSPNEKATNNRLHLLPFSAKHASDNKTLSNFNHSVAKFSININNVNSATTPTTLALFNYPEITKKSLNLADNAMVVSGYLSPFGKQVIVEYKIIGENRHWSGYIIAKNIKSIASSLKNTIAALQSTSYFSEPNSALLSAKLRLLLDNDPNNQAVIYHLLQLQFDEKKYDAAKALAEKLITLNKNQKNAPYFAIGITIKGAIYHQQKAFNLALQHYKRALTQLRPGMFLEIRYQIEIYLAWLAFAENNIEKMQLHVSNASHYAEQNQDILAQVSAHTTGSILSHKLGNMVNRYKYLETARSLLLSHNVAQAHFGIIYYHLALFAPNKQEAESYYLQLLSLPKLIKYQWIYQSATEDMLTGYIDNHQWKEALSLFHSQPENSFNLGQKAKLMIAMGDGAAINTAKQAFDQARINHQHNDALHAALLLYQLQDSKRGQIDEAFTNDYQDYIRANASKFWLNKHKGELIELGYFNGMTSPLK